MNATQAEKHNEQFPYTVAPCDCNQSFPRRSFTTLDAAVGYGRTQSPRPWIVALPSGAIAALS